MLASLRTSRTRYSIATSTVHKLEQVSMSKHYVYAKVQQHYTCSCKEYIMQVSPVVFETIVLCPCVSLARSLLWGV